MLSICVCHAAPCDGRPCVWYSLNIFETRYYHGKHGRRSVNELVYLEEKSADFYLSDGVNRVFIQGSQRGNIKVHGTADTSATTTPFIQGSAPQAIQVLIAKHQAAQQWPIDAGGVPSGIFSYAQVLDQSLCI
jgi:hypothetical protein